MLDKHVASHTKPFSCGKPHACPTCLDTERFCYNGHMTNSLAGSVSHPESPPLPFPPLLPGPTGPPPASSSSPRPPSPSSQPAPFLTAPLPLSSVGRVSSPAQHGSPSSWP